MYFEPTNIYHIYNQGNNRQKIFFCRAHYLFFLKKIRQHILPYTDILAWCLMPNHFHLMVQVIPAIHPLTWSERMNLTTPSNAIHTLTPSERMNPAMPSELLLNQLLIQNIATMLRSYTRAINKEQNHTGSLFRSKTKAECITKMNGVTPSFYNTAYGTIIKTHDIEKEYPKRCFDYIHNNPVQAGVVEKATDWEFSSARDYQGLRNGKMINRELAKKLFLWD